MKVKLFLKTNFFKLNLMANQPLFLLHNGACLAENQ
jgi:hypothetical protein